MKPNYVIDRTAAGKPLTKTAQVRMAGNSVSYALSDEAIQNSKDETLWCSPHCVPQVGQVLDLFAEAA